VNDQSVVPDDGRPGERDRTANLIKSRIRRFIWDCDPDLVLNQDAAREIGSLEVLVPDPFASPEDLEAIRTGAFLAWLRYLAAPAGQDRPAFGVAAGLFFPVYVRNPGSVPDYLHALFAQALAEAQEQPAALLGRYARWCDEHDGAKDSMLAFSVDALSEDDNFRAGALANLAMRLASGTPGLRRLNVAIQVLQYSIEAGSDADADQAARWNNLAGLREDRFGFTGLPGDLDEAVGAMRRAIALHDRANGASHQSNLSGALQRRYLLTGQERDLDEALEAATRAVREAPDTASFRHNLGCAQMLRYPVTGRLEDLEEALATGREALRSGPSAGPERAAILSQLGVELRARHDLTGHPADLEDSIKLQRQAIDETADADHVDRAIRLNSLATAVGQRYGQTEELADLHASIMLNTEVLRLSPERSANLTLFLSNYGGAIRARYERTEKLEDLDQAIDVIRLAFTRTASTDPRRYLYGNNVGAALAAKYRVTGQPAVLDDAIRVLQATVDGPGSGADVRQKASALATLGTALTARFELTRAVADADAARQAYLSAIALTPESDVRRTRYGVSLASLLSSPAAGTADEADSAVALAILAEATANPAVPTSVRIASARSAASLHARAGRWPAAAAMGAQAVRLLPLTAPRELRRVDAEHWLGRFTDLAADAAACSILAGEAEDALMSLELGRGILLAQALQLRDAAAALRESAPELAARFERIRAELDEPDPELAHLDASSPGPRPAAGAQADGGQADGGQAEVLTVFDQGQARAARRRGLVTELAALTAEIRELPGFARFLEPPTMADMRAAAADGPIVFLNVSSYASHALILTAAGVRPAVGLPGLSPERVAGQVTAFTEATRAAQKNPEQTERTIRDTLDWLWATTAGPVLDDLGITGSPDRGQPFPRLWWSPVGLLSYLPIHAAGRTGDAAATALDRVVSSYTPTAYALRESRKRSRRPDRDQSMLVVAMPRTPGAPDLPGAGREADLLVTSFPEVEVLGTWPAAAGPATRQSVIDGLQRHAHAHFACHGQCDQAEPALSMLQVGDREHDPLTIADVASLNLAHARFAYLSACETALTGPKLTNEALHLVTAFGLAGYPGVIGTLWSIDDGAAFSIARDLYAAMAQETPPETPIRVDLAATALHETICDLRDRRPGQPSLWAAHIHVGA
jgi:tetratricopeptide (TPR) repeat protein